LQGADAERLDVDFFEPLHLVREQDFAELLFFLPRPFAHHLPHLFRRELGATFASATALTGTILTGTILTGTILTGTILTGTLLTGTLLRLNKDGAVGVLRAGFVGALAARPASASWRAAIAAGGAAAITRTGSAEAAAIRTHFGHQLVDFFDLVVEQFEFFLHFGDAQQHHAAHPESATEKAGAARAAGTTGTTGTALSEAAALAVLTGPWIVLSLDDRRRHQGERHRDNETSCCELHDQVPFDEKTA
jgi:hypothetical protein